jgi:hypothetical protein
MEKFNDTNEESPSITAESLIGDATDTQGEYMMHVEASAQILNLAVREGVLDQQALDIFVHDFKGAQNAFEVLKVRQSLTSLLYREAIDYSDILYKTGVIGRKDFEELKSNIGRGRVFTNQDLDQADELDKIAHQAAHNLRERILSNEDSLTAGERINEGLAGMQARRAIFPDKNKETDNE